MIYVICGAVIVVAVIVAVVVAVAVTAPFKREFRDPISKGKQGENLVANILGDTIPGEQYVINDLLFAVGNGQSCQIDHIYINKYGIWVIETKNYSGKIYGNANANKWTQVLAYGKEKNKFYNPIKQNQTHIYRLSNYLKVKGVFNNVVVFLFDANITDVKADVYAIERLHTIKTQVTKITLSVEQMERYYKLLLQLKSTATVSEEEHVSNIYDTQQKIANGVCPRCGGKLVLRKGKYGMFYGCTNYPKCKFTKKTK